jgi:hypothetical protein
VTASAWQALQDDLAALTMEISEKPDKRSVNKQFEELNHAMAKPEESAARMEWQHSTT